MNRRQFAKQTGATLFSPVLLRLQGKAESGAQAETAVSYREQMPDMLVSYLARRLNDLSAS